MNIRIKKIAAQFDAPYSTPLWEDYTPGTDNGNVSIPLEYWIEGILQAPIEVGYAVNVLRKIRNGVEVGGWFQTSIVIAMTDKTFDTKNSRYSYEQI